MNQKGTLVLILLIIFVAVLGLGVGIGIKYYIEKKPRIERVEFMGALKGAPPISFGIAEKKEVEETPAEVIEVIVTGKPIDCGADWDCLIEAAKVCSSAQATLTQAVFLFGVLSESTGFYEIKGLESKTNKCIYYSRTEKVKTTLPPGTPEKAIKETEAIDKQLEGKYSICKTDALDLAATLERWKGGSFSTEDLTAAECRGTAYEPILPPAQ